MNEAHMYLYNTDNSADRRSRYIDTPTVLPFYIHHTLVNKENSTY